MKAYDKLGWQTTKLAHILKSKPEIYKSYFPQWGKRDAVFTCPTAIIFKFYLPGAMGQAPMLSPGPYYFAYDMSPVLTYLH